MQGARALVEVLAGSGVRHIFGLPGDTGMPFYDALLDKRGQIEQQYRTQLDELKKDIENEEDE